MIQLDQQPIDRQIGDEIAKAMPSAWPRALLTVRLKRGGGQDAYELSMGSPENRPGVAMISQEVRDAVRQLFLLHKRYGTNMTVARYIVENNAGQWRVVSEFEYED